MPASTKYVIDEVIGNGRTELLLRVAFAVACAIFLQAITTFALSQIMGVAAQTGDHPRCANACSNVSAGCRSVTSTP